MKFIRSNLWLICSILLLVIAGCAALDSVFLPKSDGTPSDVVGTVDKIGGVATVAAAAGIPWAAVVSGFCGLFGTLGGIYGRLRGKQAAAADDKAAQTTAILEAVVAAVEASEGLVVDQKGTTVGTAVKELIQKKLEDKDVYQVGKALITALKAGLKKE